MGVKDLGHIRGQRNRLRRRRLRLHLVRKMWPLGRCGWAVPLWSDGRQGPRGLHHRQPTVDCRGQSTIGLGVGQVVHGLHIGRVRTHWDGKARLRWRWVCHPWRHGWRQLVCARHKLLRLRVLTGNNLGGRMLLLRDTVGCVLIGDRRQVPLLPSAPRNASLFHGGCSNVCAHHTSWLDNDRVTRPLGCLMAVARVGRGSTHEAVAI
mmetsp:Transcript_7575/g.23576  ORF Transcript_7575/g.23576 Transcript_7575/m.23576 type:complete len:207 (+) Transcript_7575:748-1368(+)